MLLFLCFYTDSFVVLRKVYIVQHNTYSRTLLWHNNLIITRKGPIWLDGKYTFDRYINIHYYRNKANSRVTWIYDYERLKCRIQTWKLKLWKIWPTAATNNNYKISHISECKPWKKFPDVKQITVVWKAEMEKLLICQMTTTTYIYKE